MTATGSPRAQWRLRALLLCAAAAPGAAWAAIAQDMVLLDGAGLLLSGRAPGRVISQAMLLACLIPVGSLAGALPADLWSRVGGRRPAIMLSGALVVLGAGLAAVAGPGWARAGALVAGLGLGGFSIVAPKLAHELAVRGHRRLMPRLAAAVPVGAGLALIAASPGPGGPGPWLVCVLLAVTVVLLAATLPETPHWYAARGRIESAYGALRRAQGALEAAIAIDWVRHDAGMQGEQRPLGREDLRIERVRHTVLAGLILELVQALPFGLTAIALAPAALLAAAQGQPVAPWAPWAIGVGWVLVGPLGLRRRTERWLLAWVLGGTGAAACAVMLLALLPRLPAGGRTGLLVLVAVVVVVGQFVAVCPACIGGIDPMVPPWLLRSQRRAGAVLRPVAAAVAVLVPTALAGIDPVLAVALVLGCQVGGLLLTLLALPRVLAALR